MKCFKYTVSSSDGNNGYYPINSQGNTELNKLLNDGKKYKLVVSKFINIATELPGTNIINSYYLTVSFKNMSFENAYTDKYLDNVVVRTNGKIQYVDSRYFLTCEETYNVQNNNVGIYSSDNIIRNGNLNIEILYADPITGDLMSSTSALWILEFFIIFD